MSKKVSNRRILVTGGLGYIGSHTVVALSEQGYEPVIVDNLSNSSKEVIKHLETLTGRTLPHALLDVCRTDKLSEFLGRYTPYAVIHFAALKSVSESIKAPIDYYSNNVGGTISLLQAMRKVGLSRIIFSSSATVYGNIVQPATEDLPFGIPVTPYGATKIQCEQILRDVTIGHPDWSVTALRYFNPIGAHESGLIGDNPRGTPGNLLPYVTQVAAGQLTKLSIFGDNYDTPDGTCIRDYLHVVDLAKGHVAALEKLQKGYRAYNLGTGHGSSVKEVIRTFERVNRIKIPYKVVDRRKGDLPNITADPSKAWNDLGWKTELTLDNMCQDAWNWQIKSLNEGLRNKVD